MRKVIGFVAVAVMGSGLVLAQGQGMHRGWDKAPGKMGAGPKGFGGGLGAPQLERLGVYLGLSDQQMKDAQTIFEAARQEEDKIEPQLQDTREKIEALVKSPAAQFDAQVQPLVTTLANLLAQELSIQAKARNRFWNLLTPEQQAKAEELRKFMRPGPPNKVVPTNP